MVTWAVRAAKSESMRSTFVVDKKDQKRARLSWYHPDDTVSYTLAEPSSVERLASSAGVNAQVEELRLRLPVCHPKRYLIRTCGCLQMVPRGWWKLGLLEDLKYYKPFATAT